MIKYNICFVRRGPEILLLNRDYAPWMGCWNGVGGKLEGNETPRESMIRELYEETQIQECRLTFKGLITWTADGKNPGGMYLYVADIPEDYSYVTPIKTDEGILDWKSTEWILSKGNVGIAANIPASLETILHDPNCYEHHCIYKDGKLCKQTSTVISELVETNEKQRASLFEKYLHTSHDPIYR
ncbi:8-oxo-dGTP diphosphatase [Paenibacillus glucanolyticus]|jgi:8-oxo-dGTP diphosphatase|uniref:NUDIX hydrolase n=1 Tax=Paenibacillus TaxID=44249 RepID=UPI00056D99B8|nr:MULTISPECIES: 8-oxo-dGTP diphosphatase [Paenibacillus]ANA78584.1 DNA mismatch repair protein MutT [Paenibacillus glucanolyticus]AVV57500.1 8-oxo-dGTP diphosphatase [Paenibacillus glucanolyticus]